MGRLLSRLLPCLAMLGIAAAAPALADDETGCAAGIAMLQAEVLKGPPEPALAKLKQAVAKAEHEREEHDFDDCVEAINDGRQALAKAEKGEASP